MGNLIRYELGDPDEDEPELRQRRITDFHEVTAILKRLEMRLGSVPRVWDLDHDALIAGCKSAGWAAVPLPHDLFGDADEEAPFLLAEAANRNTSLIHVNCHSSERSYEPGWKSWLRWKGRSNADTFRRGNDAPEYDVYRIEEAPTHLDGRWWYGIVTTPQIDFCVIEGDEVHVLAGPSELIEAFTRDVPLSDHWQPLLDDTVLWAGDSHNTAKARSEQRSHIENLVALYASNFGLPTGP